MYFVSSPVFEWRTTCTLVDCLCVRRFNSKSVGSTRHFAVLDWNCRFDRITLRVILHYVILAVDWKHLEALGSVRPCPQFIDQNRTNIRSIPYTKFIRDFVYKNHMSDRSYSKFSSLLHTPCHMNWIRFVFFLLIIKTINKMIFKKMTKIVFFTFSFMVNENTM